MPSRPLTHSTAITPTGTPEWTTSLADCIARVYGIDPLTEVHWRVISECREEWARSGRVPRAEQLAARSHLTVDELRDLFPEGQTDLAWILAGVVPPSMPSAENASRKRSRNGRGRHASISSTGEGASPSLEKVPETLTTKEKP